MSNKKNQWVHATKPGTGRKLRRINDVRISTISSKGKTVARFAIAKHVCESVGLARGSRVCLLASADCRRMMLREIRDSDGPRGYTLCAQEREGGGHNTLFFTVNHSRFQPDVADRLRAAIKPGDRKTIPWAIDKAEHGIVLDLNPIAD